MGNLPCGIIRDLLPSYADGLCGGETKAAVETHIAECPACRAELDSMRAALQPASAREDSDARNIEQIARAWNRTRRKALRKGILLTVCVCVALLLVFYALYVRTYPLRPGAVDIQAYMLANGNIVCEYTYTDGDPYTHTTNNTFYPDGTFYTTVAAVPMPFRAEQTYQSLYHLDKYGQDIGVKAIYYGSKNNRVLIWEEGMTLPPATPEMEAEFGNQ